MNGGASIKGSIDLSDDEGSPIAETRIETMRENDKYKAIMGDCSARVTVGLDESIGGPYGYSNAKIRVSVTLSCDQSEESMEKAKRYALDECLTFIEDRIGTSYKQLTDHLERYYHKEAR